MELDLTQVKQEAHRRYKQKIFDQAVEEYVKKLEAKKWWHIFMPFKIVIIRRERV
jgi:hypothetical protein